MAGERCTMTSKRKRGEEPSSEIRPVVESTPPTLGQESEASFDESVAAAAVLLACRVAMAKRGGGGNRRPTPSCAALAKHRSSIDPALVKALELVRGYQEV